ncbi:MAG: DUF3616 domain-containing protein [Desulfobacterales bacterium]|nr:DUF3616 domain-containing protein [Desulfobacterales bacterium]
MENHLVKIEFLRHILKNDNVLKAFTQIPSKENGIDIEGIAAKNGLLYIGFRGPVFRGNYVPVLKLKFDNPDIYEIVYVQLGGFGIRGLTKVSDGFLILAGPVGDRKSSYQIFHWNGFDMIPGKNRTGKKGLVSKMYEIEPPKGGKAEGIAVINEERSHYKIILVYDGVKIIGNIFQRLIIQKK